MNHIIISENITTYAIGWTIGMVLYIVYRVIKSFTKEEEYTIILKEKYPVLINHILNRNSDYQMREIDANNVKLICTGITFTLTEVNRNLQITYVWDSFSTGKTYRHQWRFNENKDQNEMYEEIDKEIGIQSMMDSGFTREQAEDIAEIKYAKSQAEQEILLDIFSKKHPHLWEMMN